MMDYLERDFFTQSCALKMRSTTQDAETNEATNTYAVVHDDVPCRVAAPSGGERRMMNGTVAEMTHRIVVSGDYSDVDETWIATVDEQDYEILLVGRTAEQVLTRLDCRILR
jgi:hypothetical protein